MAHPLFVCPAGHFSTLREVMKSTAELFLCISPFAVSDKFLTIVVEIENDTNLMSAPFNDGNGSIGKDDNGGYEGGDALSREDKSTTPNLWEQVW